MWNSELSSSRKLVGKTQTLKPPPTAGLSFCGAGIDSKSPARGLADRALRGYEIRATTNAGGPLSSDAASENSKG